MEKFDWVDTRKPTTSMYVNAFIKLLLFSLPIHYTLFVKGIHTTAVVSIVCAILLALLLSNAVIRVIGDLFAAQYCAVDYKFPNVFKNGDITIQKTIFTIALPYKYHTSGRLYRFKNGFMMVALSY